jgi:hypothetical protein
MKMHWQLLKRGLEQNDILFLFLSPRHNTMAPAAPLDTLNKVIGQVPVLCLSKFPRLSEGLRALLIGAFVNSMLYMLEILEVIKYFRCFPNDTKRLKCSIVTLILLDSTCTFAQWTCIYLYGVLHWGDLDYLGYENLAIPIYIYTRSGTFVSICGCGINSVAQRDHRVHCSEFPDFAILQVKEAADCVLWAYLHDGCCSA